MKEILLTQGQVALVDDSDYEWLNQWKWLAHYDWRGECFYAQRNAPRTKNKRVTIHMAREIIKCPENRQVDHADGNTLNNQRINLRTCTYTENFRNRRKIKECSSEYKGVCWHKRVGQWTAQIQTRDIFDQPMKLHLGCFKVEKEAALAYDKAASEEFGEFARLNFP